MEMGVGVEAHSTVRFAERCQSNTDQMNHMGEDKGISYVVS